MAEKEENAENEGIKPNAGPVFFPCFGCSK